MQGVAVALVVAAFWIQFGRSNLIAVEADHSGRDFACYRYAALVAWDGEDLYQRNKLGARARAEGTRHGVPPYLYPPPSVLAFGWTRSLSLYEGYLAMFWANIGLLIAAGLVLWGWSRGPPALIALLLAFNPGVGETLYLGQVNLFVLVLLVVGLWLPRSPALAMAALTKISPAIHFVVLLVQRRWGAIGVGAVSFVTLSLLAGLVIPWDVQLRYYTEVLPTFWSGKYNALGVGLTDVPNFSLQVATAYVWPAVGGDPTSLGKAAAMAIAAAMLALTLYVGRHRVDRVGLAGLYGAATVIMVLVPRFSLFAHMVFLMVPLVGVMVAALGRRLPVAVLPFLAIDIVVVEFPVRAQRYLESNVPGLVHWAPLVRTVAMVGLWALCLWAAWRSAGPTEGRTPSD